MNTWEVIKLIIAMCLGYGVMFMTMWIFNRSNKKEAIQNEKTNINQS